MVNLIEIYKQTLTLDTEFLVHYLQKLIYLYQRKGGSLSVILIDLDGLRNINADKGYEFGNFVLSKLAEAVGNSIRKSDLAGVYRSGSFMIILPDSDSFGALRVVERIKNRFYAVDFGDINPTFTTSIYSFKPNGEKADDIVEALEKSIAEAKKESGGRVIEVGEKLSIKGFNYDTLLWIVRNRSVEPAFQPIYNLKENRIDGYEVLMRIIKEDGEILPASFFLEEMLKTSLLPILEEILFQKTFEKYIRYNLNGKLYINFPFTFFSPVAKGKHRIREFHKELMSFKIDPRVVVVEILESKIAGNTEELIDLVDEIRRCNFGIAVDDFGVEYSSIERLVRTKPDVVKLDRFFLKEAKNLLGWVIEGMKKMGMMVVVEHVETKEELDYIKVLGADMAQGFYLGKPQIL